MEQVPFHPNNWADNKPLWEYCKKNNIVLESYSSLTCVCFHPTNSFPFTNLLTILRPITQDPQSPVNSVLKTIAKRINATPAQVIFQWVRAKGVVIVTFVLTLLL